MMRAAWVIPIRLHPDARDGELRRSPERARVEPGRSGTDQTLSASYPQLGCRYHPRGWDRRPDSPSAPALRIGLSLTSCIRPSRPSHVFERVSCWSGGPSHLTFQDTTHSCGYGRASGVPPFWIAGSLRVSGCRVRRAEGDPLRHVSPGVYGRSLGTHWTAIGAPVPAIMPSDESEPRCPP
jgi:hypothetical protein